MLPTAEALTAEDVSRSALEEANKLLGECTAKIGHCVNQLSDEQIWWRPAASLNSIGNLMLHLCGNLEQWIVSGIGGAADTRRRPAEFAERGPMPKSVLVDKLTRVVAAAQQTLARSNPAELARERTIQGFTTTGWGAIFHSVPHFNGHAQEVVCYTRMQLGDAYKFYWQPQTPEQGAG
jgi:Protein of unknown function (DUF1572)